MLFFKRLQKKDDSKKKALQNPKILEVNLIKDEIRISFDWKKNLSVLVIVLIITGLFVAEIYFGLDWWENQENVRSEALSGSINKVKQEVNQLKLKTDEALTYKDKTIEVTNLLNNHVYWTNLFYWLERNTLSTVKYGGFTGDLSGLYSLSAKAQTYADVSWQAKVFSSSTTTKEVEIVTANSSADKEKGKESEIDFIINLSVDPNIFKK